MHKYKIRIDARGLYVIMTPVGGMLSVSFTLDRLDLALREVRRQITKDHAFSEMIKRLRAI